MKLLLGTNNRGKVIEIGEALGKDSFQLLTPQEVEIDVSPEETGKTFDENALLKARFYYDKSSLPTIADDSGLIVDALKDELGIHTRRWGAGPDASDAEWIEYFLQRMETEENRKASFVCALALIDETGAEHVFTGECSGVITESLEADYLPGLPISACFKPDGFNAVYSAMSIEDKNAVSHRGKAVALLRAHLENTNR